MAKQAEVEMRHHGKSHHSGAYHREMERAKDADAAAAAAKHQPHVNYNPEIEKQYDDCFKKCMGCCGDDDPDDIVEPNSNDNSTGCCVIS